MHVIAVDRDPPSPSPSILHIIITPRIIVVVIIDAAGHTIKVNKEGEEDFVSGGTVFEDAEEVGLD